MKQINQIWEKRNLGIDSIEFRFDADDNAHSVIEAYNSCPPCDYILARVPDNKMDIAYKLQELGFRFSETNLHLSCNLKKLVLPNIFAKFYEHITEDIATDEEIELIYNSIKNGVFDTDKIALDPKFGKEKAGYRYYQWCKDELEKGTSTAYILYFDGKPIGFYILKKVSDLVYDSLLAGLFDKSNNVGLGFSVLYSPLAQAKKLGGTTMVTGVSSNNSASLKMHLALGYEIKSLNYVFTKHMR